MILQIPARADIPAYSFRILLEGSVFLMAIRYNTRMERWIMDLSDINETPLLMGVPLLSGLDLISRYKITGLPPGLFAMLDEQGEVMNATRDELGERVKLLYEESLA